MTGRPQRVWIGVLPRDMADPAEIEGYVAICARRAWISLKHYDIEITEPQEHFMRVRAIYAVRRPVEDVIDSL